MPELENASRRIPKATYVPLTVQLDESAAGKAVPKSVFASRLALTAGEVAAVRAAPAGASAPPPPAESPVWEVLGAVESATMPAELPPLSAFAAIPTNDLVAFGHGLVALRRQAATGAGAGDPAAGAAAAVHVPPPDAAFALTQANAAIVSMKSFLDSVSATPIGMINLERVEMTPAGVERGDLIATVPLAPSEQTAVVQKEWSVTTSEFSSIVTDSLEDYSETGVTENTELAQSTKSETEHSNQFNINASASGSIGFVTMSVASGFSSQDKSSQSAEDSRKHAIATTRKASSRVKQEHKMSISTSTVSGTEETTTRQISNPSTTDPMRIDYFSMMRKWRVRLYRYGLRLTYDIAIPEPGAAMRQAHAQLDELQKELSRGFEFTLAYAGITEANYQQLASQWEAQVPPPPQPTTIQTVGGPVDGLTGDDGDEKWHFSQVSFDVPPGYAVSDVSVDYMLSNAFNGKDRAFEVLGLPPGSLNLDQNTPKASRDLTAEFGYMNGLTGHQEITFMVQYCGTAAATFQITATLTDAGREQWVAQVWSALFNAAQTAFYARQNAVAAQIAALQAQLDAVDTLTLRREESEEIMKGVLRWLLGPSFSFMPQQVVDLFGNSTDLAYGVAFTGSSLGLDSSQWTTMFQYEEMVKFINEAIDWENILYFLYSYVWDVPESWQFVRQIRHSDATRQAFLRAGSARVVLTIRPGYEEAWTSFVELGDFGTILPPTHPYMSIAQEIQSYDNTNYPGIPPANPDDPNSTDDSAEAGELLAEWYEYTPTSGTDIAVTSDLTTIA